MQINWNDLKYLLLLARHGRMNAVAKESGVDVTTASRRLKALELALGTQLFIRIDNRYLPTEALQAVLANAEAVEREIACFQRNLLDHDTQPSGRLRVTSVHTFINSYLLPKLPAFYQRFPDIKLELIADSNQLDLARHEADIAIRMGRPEQKSIVTRRLSKLHYSVYAHQNLLKQNHKIDALPWVLFEERYKQLPEARWQQQHYPDVNSRLYCNVGPAMYNAVQHQIGLACLPCYMAQPGDGLVALLEPFPLRELWCLFHPEKRHLAKIRVFIDWLAREVEADQQRFLGHDVK